MYKFADRFDVASPLLWLQPGSKTYQFWGFGITSKEVRNDISVSTMETLKKIDGIVEKSSNVKQVSAQAKNYEPFWDKIKNVDTQSEDYEGVMWLVHATCHSNFHNKKKLETNSKTKNKWNDEQNSKDIDLVSDERTNPEESVLFLRRTSGANVIYPVCFVLKRMNYIILNTVH